MIVGCLFNSTDTDACFQTELILQIINFMRCFYLSLSLQHLQVLALSKRKETHREKWGLKDRLFKNRKFQIFMPLKR